MKNNNSICTECGALLENVQECRVYLNEMIKWDFEDFNGVGKIHHLTVLCYNLQHPSVYSEKGLEDAKQSLQKFLHNPQAFKAHDESNRKKLASDIRDWKITGTTEDHGEYLIKPCWTMSASDVLKGGLGVYMKNVEKWSQSVLDSLKSSGNLD